MFIKEYIQECIHLNERLLAGENILLTVEAIANVIIQAYSDNKKLLIAGNGGSAADAQHIAAEFVAKFKKERDALCAIALTVNTSVLTAISNDHGFETVFSRQIKAFGQKGDIFLAISTSGNSENIILALKEAKERGLITVGMTGENECKMDGLCDYLIKVPSADTPHIQEIHIMLGHIICAITEKKLFEI